MLWILIRKELLHHLLTLRLGVAFIITIVLVVLTTFIGRVDYSLRLESYGDEVKSIREAMDQATVYSQVEPAIVLSPQPLSIFCLGVDGICGERERGTLAQLLTNPIPRGTIIAAKLVGGWPCGSPWL
jgi:ABC-type transport system involved in multi-copper enzyme maturation permease subunit